MDGKKIAVLRKERNLSQEKLANKLNVSRSTVAMWENNSNEPPISMLIKLTEILNVSFEEILSIKKENNTNILNENFLNAFLSNHELKVIEAYRNKPEMRNAVDLLLDVERKEKTNSLSPTTKVKIAARDGINTTTELTEEQENKAIDRIMQEN